jgi:type IV secretory pathway VirB10-like protein
MTTHAEPSGIEPELNPDNIATARQPLTATRRLNPLIMRIEVIGGIIFLVLIAGAFIVWPMLGRHTDQQKPQDPSSFAATAAPLIPNTGVAPVGDTILSATPKPLPSGSDIALGGAPVPGAPTGTGTSGTPPVSSALADQLAAAKYTVANTNPEVTVPPVAQPPPPSGAGAPRSHLPDADSLLPAGFVPPPMIGSGPPAATSIPATTPNSPNSDVMISGGIQPSDRATQAPQPAATVGGQLSAVETQNARRAQFASASGTGAYHSARLEDPISRYEVFAGTPLRLQLDDAINTSTTPCTVTAHVQYDVHASLKPYPVVIPALAKIIGRCNTNVTSGDSRVEVAWDTMTFPNGQTFDLQGMASSDTTGAGGMPAKVDSHTGQLLTTTILTAILGAGAQLSQPAATSILTAPTLAQQAAGAIGGAVAQTGNALVQQQVQRPPTLTIERGRQFIVRLRATLVLDPTGYDASAANTTALSQ